jgi:hypothetical protein
MPSGVVANPGRYRRQGSALPVTMQPQMRFLTVAFVVGKWISRICCCVMNWRAVVGSIVVNLFLSRMRQSVLPVRITPEAQLLLYRSAKGNVLYNVRLHRL